MHCARSSSIAAIPNMPRARCWSSSATPRCCARHRSKRRCRRSSAARARVGWLIAQGKLGTSPITGFVAAVSVGVCEGTPLLDLEYLEDSACDTDMNVVMTGTGGFVEVQGTAEGVAFSREEMDLMLGLADK